MKRGDRAKRLPTNSTTVRKLRLSNLEGKLLATDLQKVEQAIRTQLDL